MLSPEERALITQLQDRMIEVLVEKEAAEQHCDAPLVDELQSEFDELKAECHSIRTAGADAD
jgi:hypothetical protein